MLVLDRSVAARAQINHGWMSVDLYLFSRDQQGNLTHAAKPVTFAPVEDRHQTIDPTLRLSEEAAQQLATDLWDAGVRPKQARSRDDEVCALKAHIADLQKVALSEQHERIPAAILEKLIKFVTEEAEQRPTTHAIGIET